MSSSTRGEFIPQVRPETFSQLGWWIQLGLAHPVEPPSNGDAPSARRFVYTYRNVLDDCPGFGCQSELELRVAEAARRQYNKLKMQTKAEIRQTIDQLLVGEFIVRVK